MSLINKMLIDLETRQDGKAAAARPRPVFEDLHPSLGMAAPRRAPRMLLVALVVIAASVIAWILWPHTQPAPIAPVASSNPPVKPNAAPKPSAITKTEPVAESPAVPPPSVAAATVNPEVTPLKSESAVASSKPPASAPAIPAPPVAVQELVLPPPVTPLPPTAPATSAAKVEPKSLPKARAKTAPALAAAKPALTSPPSAAEDSVIDKKAHVLTAEEQAEQLYREGVAALKKGRRFDAEQELRNALAKHATHVKAREVLAGLYIDAHRWGDATTVLNEGIELLPQQTVFAQLAARAYVEQGQDAKALAVLQAARPSALNDPDFLGFEATLLQRAGRHADAVNQYRVALNLRPLEPRLWVGVGISYEAQQQWREAEDAYLHARDLGNAAPALVRYANERLAIVKSKL